MAGGRGREGAAGEAVALGEARVRALGAAVGQLDGPEQRLLEPVAGLLVQRLVGGAERGERDRQPVDRLGDLVEQLLPGL